MAPFNLPRIAQKDLPTNPEIAAEITEAVADVDTREIYFLIMHFLLSGPCRKMSGQIWNELLEHDLLPRRYHAWYSRSGAVCSGEDDNDNGSSLPLTYQDLVSRYPHIATDHLVKLMKQLVLFSSFPSNGFVGGNTTNGIDVSSLLGSGAFSLLGSDKGKLKKSDHLPRYLRWPHMHANQVHGLSLREIGGGFAKHSRAPSIRAACYAIAKPSTMVQKMPVIKKLRGHQNAVYCAIFDRSGRYVITGSDDRLVKIWSMETAFCLSSCRGHEGDITDLTVSSKNDLVASGSNDFTIRVWRLPDGLPISVLKGHTGGVTAITFSPRPTSMYHLLSSSDDGTCRIWDARYSNPSLRVYIPKALERRNTNPEPSSGHRVHQILCCAYNANGTIFVTGSSDTYARVWIACRTNQEDSELPNHEMDLLSGHENDVNYVQFSGCAVPSKSSTVDNSKEDNIPKFKNSWFTHDNIVTCSRDGSAIIWIPRSRKSHGKVGKWIRAYHLKVPPPPLPPQPPRGGPRQRSQPTPRGVNMIVWSLDNRFVLAAIMDRRICVWNASDGSLVHSLIGHNDSTFVLDVHPFNPRIAMSAGYDGKTIIWDIWEGIPVRIYETGHFKLVDGKFSPDGTSIVLSDEVGQIFIIATGQGESQKDAKYDQFFLGDYRPLIHDAHGSTLDQETQLAPYSRNMQDLLCDSSMIPYPEPYQSMYQRRRLSALGIEWRPPSLQFAVGPSDNINAGEYQTLPIVDLERWVESLQAMPDFVDAMDWEQENEVQSDDNDSEYNVTEELSSEREHCSLSSSGDLESSAEESEDNSHSGREGLRRSRRKESKRHCQDTVFTTSGRRVKRKNLDEHKDIMNKSKMKKRTRNGASTSKKKSSKSKLHRPQRRAAKNARTLFSKYDEEASSDEEVAEASDSYTSESDSPLLDYIDHSNESELSDSLTEQSHEKGIKRCEYEEVSIPTLNETPSNAVPKKKLLLRLPFRDPMKTISSENTTSISHEQNEFKEQMELPSAKHGSTSNNVNGLLPSPHKLDSSLMVKDDPILSQCDAGNSFLGVQAQREYQHDIPVGCMVSKGSWGEVKIRSAKRTRLCETSTMETLNTCPMGSEDAIVVSSSVNGEIKSDNDCQASFSQSRNQSNGHAFFREDYQNNRKCADGISEALDSSENQEPDIGKTLTLEHPLHNGISNEKNTLLDAFKDIGKEMAWDLDLNNVESVNQKLMFTSKNSINEPGSSSKLTLVAKMPGGLNGIIQDVGVNGSSELINWTNGSSRISRGQNLVYSRSKSRSRRGSKADTDGIKDSGSSYQNHKDNQSVDVNCNSTTKIHFTRSSSAKTNTDNPSSSSRSRWNCDNSEERNSGLGLRSSRNRRENCISPNLSSLNSGRNGSVLMLSEHEEFYRYIPQLGDEVAYLREGHAQYLALKPTQQSGSSINGNLGAVEFCKVISLGYSQFPGSGSSCCKITLEFNDPKSCAFGSSFDLTLVDFDEIPEFLVEKTRYHACMERNWTTRDKCRVWWRSPDAEQGSWYECRIVSKVTPSSLFPDSPWERYKVVYKNDTQEFPHSPWELEDLDTTWDHPHLDEAISEKIASSLEEIEETSRRNKDKHGLQKFIKASQKAEYQNRFPVPLSLEIIKRRLQNKYYRTLDAVGNDVEVMLSNAESYFGKSDFSSKIHKLKDIFKRAIQK